MGVDVVLRLKGHITVNQIVKYISENYNFIKDGTKTYTYGNLDTYGDFVKEHYGDSNKWINVSGFIDFYNIIGTKFNLFYNYSNMNAYENLEYYSEKGVEEMIKSETTYLSLPKYEDTVEILKGIAQEFGGWLDEDDYDDIPPYWIGKVEKERYWWSGDVEYYNGCFKTEQEAIEDAKNTLDDSYKTIWVGRWEIPELRWYSNEEEIINSIYSFLSYQYGDSSERFEVTQRQELELGERINKCVEQWIEDMKLKENCFVVADEHLVDLR